MATVPVVFDLEAASVPVPIGVYVRTDEDVVVYRACDGTIRQAPEDCVIVKGVEVP